MLSLGTKHFEYGIMIANNKQQKWSQEETLAYFLQELFHMSLPVQFETYSEIKYIIEGKTWLLKRINKINIQAFVTQFSEILTIIISSVLICSS